MYKTRKDLVEKIEWEGGLAEFLFSYGCSPDDAPDEEIASLLRRIYTIKPHFYKLEALLNEVEYE